MRRNDQVDVRAATPPGRSLEELGVQFREKSDDCFAFLVDLIPATFDPYLDPVCTLPKK